MPVDVDIDVADTLDFVSGLTKGTNLFMGPERAVSSAIPSKCVFV